MRAALALSLLLAPAPPGPELKARIDAVKREVRADHLDRAVALGESLVKAEPGCSPCFNWLGKAYGLKAAKASVVSQLPLARKCRIAFEKAAELDPTNLEAQFDLLSFYRQAPGIVGGGMDKAWALVPRIAAVSAARGHLARALLHERDKDLAKAEAEYHVALAADPADAAGVANLVTFLVRQERPAEALEAARAVAVAHPEIAVLEYHVGRAAALTGLEPEAGLAALDAYIAAPAPGDDAPSVADARWRRGQIREKQGKADEARAEYEAVLALDPGHAGAARDLERLRVRKG